MYEKNNISNKNINLNSGRLGIFNYDSDTAKNKEYESQREALGGIQKMSARLKAEGGIYQQDRMIFDKKRSFERSLAYSYQKADIRNLKNKDGRVDLALINPNKLKLDYDIKNLSVFNECGYAAGDIFEWLGTGTYWIVYLKDIDEKAYFRSEIRRCDYEIKYDLDGEEYSSYAYVKGPVETKIDYIQKHSISVDNPNHSISMLLPRTKENLEFFRRYAKFYLNEKEDGAPEVCWRVEATDWISSEGVLEVTAVEYYINKDEDDLTEGIAGRLSATKIIPPEGEIKGESFIKPKVSYTYEYAGSEDGSWSVSKVPAKITIDSENPKKISLKWDSAYSGQFILSFGSEEKTIVVESLF